MDPGATVPGLLENDPRVRSVRLGGSRASGRYHDFSDWDFLVETDAFATLAEDLPRIVAPIRPLAHQWDRYSSYECYMLILAGPQKVDLIFPDEAREWSAAWEVSPATLVAVDRHFWDWIMWLEQKRSGDRGEVLASGLADLYELLLRPMGAEASPASIPAAVETYLARRLELERRFGLHVPRELENEVRPVVLSRARRRA